MRHLPPTNPLLAGACAGALLAGVLALLFDAQLTNGAGAMIAPFLVNCAAAASLVVRCIVR